MIQSLCSALLCVLVCAACAKTSDTPNVRPPAAVPPMFGPAEPASPAFALNGAESIDVLSGPVAKTVKKPLILDLPLPRGEHFGLNLFDDDATFEAVVAVSKQNANGSVTVIADIPAAKFGRAVFTVMSGQIRGTVNVDGRVFVLTHAEGKKYRINEVRVDLLPNEDSPADEEPPQVPPSTTSDDELRILVVFSAALQSVCERPNVVQQFADELEAALATAGVSQTVSAVALCTDHVAMQGDMMSELTWLTHSTEVRQTRIDERADLVSMIVDTGFPCGRAYVTDPVTSASAYRGFSVVRADCAITRQSFVHEIGHNLGVLHDRLAEGGGQTGKCNYGFLIPDPANPITKPCVNRTIMGLQPANAPACGRVPFFSNAAAGRGVACTSTVIGNPGPADAAAGLPNAVQTTRTFF